MKRKQMFCCAAAIVFAALSAGCGDSTAAEVEKGKASPVSVSYSAEKPSADNSEPSNVPAGNTVTDAVTDMDSSGASNSASDNSSVTDSSDACFIGDRAQWG